jgi:hypothetical protein
MKLLFAAALFVLVGAAPPANDPAMAGRIVARHVAALGGMERIRAVHSFVKHGWYGEGTFRLDDTYTAQMRPFYRVIGDPANPKSDIHEGYDGSAWEWYEDPGIVVRTVGAAAATTRRTAAFDDPLVEPQKHGTSLFYTGRTTVEGRAVEVLRAVLADGFEQDVYVDPSSWMIRGYHRVVPMHAFGDALQTQILLDDYRPEGGVMMAHRDREIDMTSGRVLDEGGVKSVEINPALPRRYFSPPEWQRTPVQEMIQRIFDEREDTAAVLATYRDFHAAGLIARPQDDADAVDFAGYQCLKTGKTDTAVALLALNAANNPGSARAHFGFGRALQSAGRTQDAKEQFARALAIDPAYGRAKKALDALK